MATATNSVTFMDHRTFTIGDTVQFDQDGSHGLGVVRGFTEGRVTRVLVDPAADAVKGSDYWMLNEKAAAQHGRPDYWGVRDMGLAGGSIISHAPAAGAAR